MNMGQKANTFLSYSLSILLTLTILLGFPASTSAQSALEVAIHYIYGTPASGKIAYQTTAYVSILGASGNPVTDLGADNFSLIEDSQPVAIDRVDPASEEPLTLILLIDTSQSMEGSPIQEARKAGANLITALPDGSQAAVFSFHEQTYPVTDFTNDLQDASARLQDLEASTNPGSCLYDALYEAAEASAAIPPGRRTLVLLTDGADTLASGKACSSRTLEDVIDLASGGETRLPIQAVGIGSHSDKQALKRLTTLTSGRFYQADKSSDLPEVFSKITQLLNAELAIRYTSTAAPGEHTLQVEASHQGLKDQDSLNFTLPPLPTSISILYPADNQEIQGKIKISTAISGGGEAIDKVDFAANDELIGTAASAPYELEWNTQAVESGAYSLTATAYAQDGTELCRSHVTVMIVQEDALPEATATPKPTTAPSEPPAPAGSSDGTGIKAGIILGAVVLVLAVLALLILILLRSRKKSIGPSAGDQNSEISISAEELTMDGFEFDPGKGFASLTVLLSDDPHRIGQTIKLHSTTTIGRHADNDLAFSKDTPVSRRHAAIEKRGQQVILSEVVAQKPDGSGKKPTYGTYVNDHQVGETPVDLKSNDTIRLGNRLEFRIQIHAEQSDAALAPTRVIEPHDPD